VKKLALLILAVGSAVVGYGTKAGAFEALAASKASGQAATSGSVVMVGEMPVEIAKPSNPADANGWSAYLRVITQQNSQGLTQASSYLYFVPLEGENARARQIEELRDLAHRRIRPGNLVAFAGPDSVLTADVLVEAFRGEAANWAQGATVLFIGAPGDKQRVFDALKASGAALRFADMQSTPSVRVSASGTPLPRFILPPPPPPPAPPPPAPAPGCPEKTSEGCASLFARDMTDIISRMNTGRGPFLLVAVTSAGSQATMTYKGDFTAQKFADFLASKGQTREGFLSLTHEDFTRYQCAGPIKDLLKRGVKIRNTLTFGDGSTLDSFNAAQCP
jgi:hypothetical protein